MSQSRSQVLDASKRKATLAGLTATGAVALGALGMPVAAVGMAVPAAVLAWRWWKHRADNGIRF
jgi:hypothetical protein